MVKHSKTVRAAEVVGYVQDVDRDVVSAKLRFRRHDGTCGEQLLPRGDLRSKKEIRKVLDPQGVNYDDVDLDRIVAAHQIDSAKVAYSYSKFGWRDSQRFGLPGRVIEENGHDLAPAPIDDDGPLATFGQRRGDLEAWNAKVVPAIAASSYAIFSVGVAFAGPLLRFSQVTEGVTYAISGEEGVGKTSCCVAAQAVMGNPDRHLLPSWDATRAGLKDLLADFHDTVLIIDDTSRDNLSAKDRLQFWADIGHAIAGGGKRNLARSHVAQHGAPAPRRPTLGLTSGEIAPEDLAKLTGTKMMGGAQVRFVDLPAPPKAEGGVFDLAVKEADADAIVEAAHRAAERLQAATSQTYGVAFDAFLDYLETHYGELPALIRRLEKEFVKAVKTGQKSRAAKSNLRVARKFGLVQAGLLLAIEAGALPLKRAQAREAVRVCFEAAQRREVAAKQAQSRLVRELKAVLRDTMRVPRLQPGQKPAPTDPGFRRKLNGVAVAFMRAEKIGEALDLDDAGVQGLVSYLAERGHLHPGTGGDRTRPVKVAGRPVRHYVFRASFYAKRRNTKRPKKADKRSLKQRRLSR